MNRVPGFGSVENRLAQLEASVNHSPVLFGVTSVGSPESITTTGTSLGGITVDRAWLQRFAPDTQWVVRAAGLVDPTDANGITVSLVYRENSGVSDTLISATWTGAGIVKKTLGPVDVFATGGVPTNEAVPLIRLNAAKVVSGTAILAQWTIWLELRANIIA